MPVYILKLVLFGNFGLSLGFGSFALFGQVIVFCDLDTAQRQNHRPHNSLLLLPQTTKLGYGYFGLW